MFRLNPTAGYQCQPDISRISRRFVHRITWFITSWFDRLPSRKERHKTPNIGNAIPHLTLPKMLQKKVVSSAGFHQQYASYGGIFWRDVHQKSSCSVIQLISGLRLYRCVVLEAQPAPRPGICAFIREWDILSSGDTDWWAGKAVTQRGSPLTRGGVWNLNQATSSEWSSAGNCCHRQLPKTSAAQFNFKRYLHNLPREFYFLSRS